jgi:hypothetical protein
LADLLTPLLAANPFSAVRALVRWWSNDEFEDGLTHRWQGWLRWRPVDSFFPHCGFEPAMLEESVSNHGHERVAVEALPEGAPRSGRDPVLLSVAGEPARKSIAP